MVNWQFSFVNPAWVLKGPLIRLTLLWFVFLASNTGFAQKILNGSLESPQVQCGYNLSNEDFSSKMPYVTGFGEKNELDILEDDCDYGPAQDGRHFVALFCKAGISDAIALQLSEPFDPQLNYTLEFYAKIGQTNDLSAQLTLGITQADTSHGAPLFSTSELYREWTRYRIPFKPAIGASFITVRVETGGEVWIFADHFSLVCPTADLGPDTTYCTIDNLRLEVEDVFDIYRWNDQSTGNSLTVHVPGLYWVEAVSGGCIVRDSIRILEDEFNCICRVYAPNVFSPNDDGVNDRWRPVSRCPLQDYELLIFNRWGGLVFQSKDPSEGWSGRDLPAGVYPFLIRYRTLHGDPGERREQGMVTLVR